MSSPPICPETPTKSSKAHLLSKPRNERNTSNDAKTAASIRTPSASSSPSGSPRVELILDDDSEEHPEQHGRPVAIIDDDDEVDNEIILDIDPMQTFPYSTESESLCATVRKIARFLEFGEWRYLH